MLFIELRRMGEIESRRLKLVEVLGREPAEYNVLIVGRLEGKNVSLKAALLETKLFDVELVNTAQKAVESVASTEFNIIVFVLSNLFEDNVQIAMKLREIGVKAPILLLVDTVRFDDFEIVGRIASTSVLQVPFKERDFLWLCKEMVQAEFVNQRIYPRFYVNHRTFVEVVGDGITLTTYMRNYSKGGACFVFSGGPKLERGERVIVRVRFGNSPREISYEAEVVWCKDREKGVYRRELGVRFLVPFPK
jgi:hypothetical protein